MLMETFTKETGRMIRLMGMVFICMLMALDMKEIGRRISNMVKALKDGLTVLCIMASTLKDKSMGEALSNGATTLFSQESSRTTTSRVMGHTNGTMVVSITEIGKIIRCMARVSLLGLTDENTQDHIRKT